MRWVKLFHEKEHKWPSTRDKVVWEKDGAGQWNVVPNMSWLMIHQGLYTARYGLGSQKKMTLTQFRHLHGLHSNLSEEKIIGWMKLHYEKEGDWPHQTSPRVWDRNAGEWTEVKGETWQAINLALRAAGRGLLKKSSLAQLRTAHGLTDPPKDHNPLSEEKIVKWIELYREKEANWPSRYGKVVWDKDAEGKWVRVGDETWTSIDRALYHGHRGLEESKGSSIAKLRQKYGLSAQPKNALTESQLVRWIRLFRENEGRWPTQASTTVWDRDDKSRQWSVVANENWNKINHALFYGIRGLKVHKGSSLAQLKLQHGLYDESKPALTEENILQWLRSFHEKEGRWPTALDKTVWDRDDKTEEWVVIDEHWGALNVGLSVGSRDLPGGSSLWQLRVANGLYEDNVLTEEKIVNWIRLFHEKAGKWPNETDRIIWDRDAKDNEWVIVKDESWKSLAHAITRGRRGLAGLKGTTLGQLKSKHGLKNEARELTTEKLISWIKLFREKTGKWPSLEDTTVWDRAADGNWLEIEDESWQGINSALRQGHRGLAACKGSSLSKFRYSHDLHENLSEEQIVSWIELFYEKEARWPIQRDKTVWDREKGEWYGVEGESWGMLDQLLRNGNRGLHAIKGFSLLTLRHKHGLDDDLDAEEIRRWIRLFHEKEDRWPSMRDSTIWEKKNGEWIVVEGESWRNISAAFRLGLRGLKAYKGSTLAEFKQRHGLVDKETPHPGKSNLLPDTEARKNST